MNSKQQHLKQIIEADRLLLLSLMIQHSALQKLEANKYHQSPVAKYMRETRLGLKTAIEKNIALLPEDERDIYPKVSQIWEQMVNKMHNIDLEDFVLVSRCVEAALKGELYLAEDDELDLSQLKD